eukprot:TRINITY_DN80164_c0_g1_i1.p1 TRINITY_DN80164_c0_g1~~TRINITY_DN80164_c0_g1_i1.p1  ORF type:complete len:621 (-),score=99.51 TRINITY_DN80164_c0_g1_i1:262-2085(-)
MDLQLAKPLLQEPELIRSLSGVETAGSESELPMHIEDQDAGSDNKEKILRSIPGIDEILEEVQTELDRMGFVPNTVDAPDPRDKACPDSWVPRDPRLNRLTGVHPFNCEAPLSVLRDHKYITPASLHYVRSHGICPRLSWHSHVIEITGLVDKPIHLTMEDLMQMPKISLPVTINCAGNRRKEQNMIKKSIGFHWSCAAVSTVIWTGVPLIEVLRYVGIQKDAKWINFSGPKGEVPLGDTKYGASHAREVCMDPTRPCMLAFLMNGELLHPDHGYPVRLVMPGYIGGRMIKWLSSITVTSEEGDNYYHIHDNRVFPKQITSKEEATKAQIWKDPSYTINDRNINSAIMTPAHCAKITVSDENYLLQGYAYAGAGRPVHRVEITLNNGRTWRTAKIERLEKPNEFGRCWCWVLWSLELPITLLARCSEIAVRAWDDSHNSQPEVPTWNLMGMMNNAWFLIKVHKLGDDQIWFEHPTQVENRHSIDRNAPLNPQNETLHLLPNGDLASLGWMQRLEKQVQELYGPHQELEETNQNSRPGDSMHGTDKDREDEQSRVVAVVPAIAKSTCFSFTTQLHRISGALKQLLHRSCQRTCDLQVCMLHGITVSKS